MSLRLHSVAVLALAAFAVVPVFAEQTGITGSATPTPIDNRQPTIAMNQFIKVSGDFDQLGTIRTFAGGVAPQGYLPANGQTLLIASNNALFVHLQTRYGGSFDAGTFALPDLRGRLALGSDGNSTALGGVYGNSRPVLGVNNLPEHTHTAFNSPTGNTAPIGGGQSYTNTQLSLGLSYRIATTGQFPSTSGATPLTPFLGEMQLSASTRVPPAAFVEAGGQLLATNANGALYTLTGNAYGGQVGANFNLPELRGRAAIGASNSQGPLSTRYRGDVVGSNSTTLTLDQLSAHTHTLSSSATGIAGSNASVDNMQPSLALNYIIAYDGIFPSASSTDSGGLPFIGEVKLYAGSNAPAGYFFCDGSSVSVANYTALFAATDGRYGYDFATDTFKLPDLRGRSIVGTGASTDGFFYTQGDQTGTETYSLTAANLPAHSHTVPEPGALSVLALSGLLLSRRRAK